MKAIIYSLKFALILSILGLPVTFIACSHLESEFTKVDKKTARTEAIKTTLPLLGLSLAVFSFIIGNYQTLQSRKVQTQIKFFDAWLALKEKIDELRDKESSSENIKTATSLFNRYYNLIQIEYSLRDQIDNDIYKSWGDYRKLEFSSDVKYAEKTYKEWWKEVSKSIQDQSFKDYMNEFL